MRESVLILCRNDRETILYAAEELKTLLLSLAGVSVWTSVGEAHSQYMKTLELAVAPEEFLGKGRAVYGASLSLCLAECRRLRHYRNRSWGKPSGAPITAVCCWGLPIFKRAGLCISEAGPGGERIPAAVGPHGKDQRRRLPAGTAESV